VALADVTQVETSHVHEAKSVALVLGIGAVIAAAYIAVASMDPILNFSY